MRHYGRLLLGLATRVSTIVAGFVIATLVLSLIVPAAQSQTAGDPKAEPIPQLDLNDPAKSLVVRVTFNGRNNASLTEAKVVKSRAPGRAADAPLLRARVLDNGGGLIEQFNAWHPLWVFQEDPDGTESRQIRTSGTGRVIFPFARDARTLKLTDVASNTEVLSADLGPAIRSFCLANPTDPDCRIADLAISSVAAITPLTAIVLGQPATVTIRTVMTNLGPTTPVDATLTRTVSADAGLNVTPAAPLTETEAALAKDELRQRDRNYTIACLQPGSHTVTFTSQITTTHPADIDPTVGNNQQQLVLTVDCAVPVAINIHPRSTTNPINLRSEVPVAVLTTQAGEYGLPLAFDATTIDPLSVRFRPGGVMVNGGAPETHGTGHPEDAYERSDEKTRDRDIDLMLHFDAAAAGLSLSDTEACVKGQFSSSGARYSFFGCDTVVVVP